MKSQKILISASTLWRQAKCSVAGSSNTVNADSSESSRLTQDELFMPDCSFSEPLAVDCLAYDSSVDQSVSFENQMISELDAKLDGHTIRWQWINESDSDSEHFSDAAEDSGSIVRDLAEWAVKYNISLSATGSLLSALRPHLPGLPKDARTLMKTPTGMRYTVRSISGGEYCHLSLADGLTYLVKKSKTAVKILELQFNVDGLPLFKSSTLTLWPILCLVKNIELKEPFIVGLFCGKEKPGNATEFLSEFVSETIHLLHNGLVINDVAYSVTIHCFCMDAPARAFVKGIKCHSGYASCEKCIVHGEYLGKVIFPDTEAPLRTDKSFDEMTDEDHHKEVCPLNPLPVGFVTQFGLDYMHLACLGVMRRLILYWKGPVGPLSVRLGRKQIDVLSSKLIQLTPFIPVEFARKPRSLDEILRWKATEFREFMLYGGAVVLNGILPPCLYDHFMLLFTSMRLLVSKEHASHTESVDYAKGLILKFVSDAQVLYGKEILVYNVHNLLHLADDVKCLGCLEDFSCFIFENTLGQLKKLIRKPQQPLQQILRRLSECHSFDSTDASAIASDSVDTQTKSEHWSGPLIPGFLNARQFKRMKTEKYDFKLSAGNDCIMLHGGVPAKIKNILMIENTVRLLCVTFEFVSDVFIYPLPSSKLGICKVRSESKHLFCVSISEIRSKCVCWPLNDDDSFAIIPLLH